MDDVKIIRRFPAGEVTAPPSKSLSHRAAICAGLAAVYSGGESRLQNLGDSEDIRATLGCMSRLGALYSRQGAETLVVKGVRARGGTMDCGESGSTLRFLLPVAAVWRESFKFTGIGRLMERPMDAYARIFAEKGLRFERDSAGLSVEGPLPAGDYRLPGNSSSQFVSGLLLALPLLEGDSRILLESPLESAPYVDLTLDMMRRFGVGARHPDKNIYIIPGGQRYKGKNCRVEGDWSQAAYFLAAGALGRQVRCAGLSPDSLQGDAAIVTLLERMGARVRWEDGAVFAEAEQLHAIDADVRDTPDIAPPLAVLCALARGTSRITGAKRLSDKESDRLSAISRGLTGLGAEVIQGEDSLTITGVRQLRGGSADAAGDHRIAMAMALAAIGCKAPVALTGWRHVNKSYPGFWEDFEKELL